MYTTQVIGEFIKAHPILVICNMIISFVYPVEDLLLPYYYGVLIDAVTDGGHKAMIKPFAWVLAILVLNQLTHVISDFQDAKFTPKIRNFVADDMVKRIFEVYETKYKELNIGELISQIVKIPYHLSGFADRIKNGLLPHMLTFLIVNIYFFYHDRTLGIGLLIMVATFSWSCLRAPFVCKNVSIQADESANELNEQIDDSLRNLISIYSSDQKNEEIARLRPYERDFEKKYEKSMRCSINTRLWVLPIILAFLILFVYRCYTDIKRKKMKVATFVSLFIMLLYVLDCMLLLTEQISDMIFDWGIICGFDELFDTSLAVENMKPHIKTVNQSGIVLSNIKFSYEGAKTPILENFDLVIQHGEKLGILGDIGSGKSTLEKLILKFFLPQQGEIYLDGVPYSSIPVKDIRKRVGYVPQNPLLFNRTVMENIRYGNEKKISESDVENLVNELGLNVEFDKLDRGLQTAAGRSGLQLSGGQRQMCLILRILFSNPEILVLDEPSSNLDEKTKKLMEKLYDRVMKDKTVILITHDDKLMKYATRSIYMVKGKIIKDSNDES